MTEVLTPEIIVEQSNAPLIKEDDAKQLLDLATRITTRMPTYENYADNLAVNNAEQAGSAVVKLEEMRNDIKAVKSAIEDHKKTAYQRHKLWTTFEKFFTDPIGSSLAIAERKVKNFYLEEERKAEEHRKKLQAEADEKARKERERLERQAEKLKTPEKREERLEEAESIVAPTIHVEAPKVSGVRIQRYWKATVVDQTAFFNAVAQRPELAGYVDISLTKIQRAKSANPMIEIPGVKFTKEVR